MKKLIQIILLLFYACTSFAQSTDAELTTQANVIRNETITGANTPLRIGNMFRALIDSKKNLDEAYTSTTLTTNNYAVTINPGVTGFTKDFGFYWKANATNTGAITLTPNGLSAKSVRKNGSTVLASGDVVAGRMYPVIYDVAQGWFQILLPGSGGGGGATAFTDLSDVPNDYTGQAAKVVVVKGDETGLEFTTPGTPTLPEVLTAGSALTSTANITSTAAINVSSEVSQHFSVGPGVDNASFNMDAATGDIDFTSSTGVMNFTSDIFKINGATGSSGQVLTSTGATTPPTWQTPSAGGTQDLQSVLDEGSSANIGDAAANITAVNATDYAQWSLTPSSFEIASSNNANTAGATFSVDTDGAHITDTRANRGLQGGADYSANIQANDYAQKVYVDAKVANAINDGTTTIAPAQDAVFDAMALKAATTDIVGTQDLFISAAAMWPRVTGGCSSLTQTELSTSLFNVQSLDFDQSIDEFAQFQVTLPRKWNNGTVTVSVYWTAASGSGNVVWSINGGAYSDDDALTVALGSAQSVTDGLTATNDLMISSATAAITLAGTPADSDFLAFQVSRDADNGSDTLNGDAKLLGISIRITTDAAKDN